MFKRSVSLLMAILSKAVVHAILFFLFFSLMAIAQEGNIRFQNISIEEGLSQSSVTCIFQDQRGFMWFGTQDGLNRFDGYEFVIYHHDSQDDTSLTDDYIRVIYEDTRGNLWIGTNIGGLDRFDAEYGVFEHHKNQPGNPHTLGNNDVRAICEETPGKLWIGTYGGGLYYFDTITRQFTRIPVKPKSSIVPGGCTHITVLYRDRSGTLWIGSETGLYAYDTSSGECAAYSTQAGDPKSLNNNKVRTICEDSVGNLWVGTWGGLNRFDRQTHAFTRYESDASKPYAISHDNVSTILEDRHGGLWIGTEGGGINIFDPTTRQFTHYLHQADDIHSLSHNDVWSFYEDRCGVLWVGTYGGGLNKFDPTTRQFIHYKHVASNPGSLSCSDTWCIYEDSAKALWVGTRVGLNRLYRRKNDQFQRYFHDRDNPQSLSNNDVRAICEDKQGRVWIGTYGGGLNRFDREKGQFFAYHHDPDNPQSISDDRVICFCGDKHKRLWVGTENGLNRFYPGKENFRRYMHHEKQPDSIGQEYIVCIYEDSRGQLWVGTDGGGLSKLVDPDKGVFNTYRRNPDDPNSLSNNVVMCILEDHTGTIWVGTYGGGLNRLKDPQTGHFKVYDEKNGLPNDSIYGILEDEKGNLWISTNRGLARFDPVKETFRNFDVEDGLQSSEFNTGAYFKNKKGEMFFGGINGFNAFFPQMIVPNPHPPQVVITGFYISNETVPLKRSDPLSPLEKTILGTKKLTLNHKQNFFSFEFAALHYVSPGKNRYLYQLDGWNETWIVTDAKNRRATYTNLPAGDYTFRVKGSNSDGLWAISGSSVQLTILPAPWRTWWAYTLYFLVFAALIFSLWFVWFQRKKVAYERSVVKRLKQVDRLKDEFLSNTSHELRTPLTGIIGVAESLINGVAGEVTPQLAENLSMVITSGKRLASLVNDILDFSRLKNQGLELQKKSVDLHSLVDIVITLSRPLVGSKNLSLINAIQPEIPPVEADEDRLQQILHNLVGNAVKFTERGEVKVSAQKQGEHIRVVIKDTGIGIPANKFDQIFKSFEQVEGSAARPYGGTGLGLAITRQLVELHGGEIHVASKQKEGSTFSFTLPIFYGDRQVRSNPIKQPPGLPNIPVFSMNAHEFSTPKFESLFRPDEEFSHHILVVDDDPITRQVLLNHLALQGYAVTGVSSGYEALDLLGKEQDAFDLVLLDIMMPRMHGYDVCRKIRQRFPAHELPVVFLTARHQASNLVAAFDAGANDFIAKPVTKEELWARVRTQLQMLEINRNLEEKVEERTQELAAKNEELKELSRNFEELSLTDPLTGLRNRRYIQEAIGIDTAKADRVYENWMRNGARENLEDSDLVFIMLDIDFFKAVNDEYDHEAGDKVLVQLARILRIVFRESDILVRWGGEEFLIVSRFISHDKARELAQRLHQVVGEHRFDLGDNRETRLTCSIGFAGYPFVHRYPRVIDWEQVIKLADISLLAAKNSGRDSCIGLLSTKKTKPKNLLKRIKKDIEKLIQNGELKVVTNIVDRQIIWKKK